METMNERRDYRHFPDAVEVRVERRADGQAVIRGTSIVFGRESVDLGGFVEEIDPAVEIDFDADTVSLFNHDANMVLGRTSAKTLTFERTKDGITYEAVPPATRQDVVELIERGDVRGNSFMFRTTKDRWERLEDGREKRTVLGMRVGEMGPVVFPAYPDTEVDVARRSRERWEEEQREQTPQPISPAERRRRELDLIG